MNTQIVNVPERDTGHKAHAKQEHPGDGLALADLARKQPPRQPLTALCYLPRSSKAAPFREASTCLVFPL